MKLTTARLKKLIREELSKVTEQNSDKKAEYISIVEELKDLQEKMNALMAEMGHFQAFRSPEGRSIDSQIEALKEKQAELAKYMSPDEKMQIAQDTGVSF